ncbi:hypothetical protein MBLNU459_g1495t2 [Dothideomycetes sp. NU459]
MPSICTNAYNWLWNNGHNGIIPQPFELVYDLDTSRRAVLNSQSYANLGNGGPVGEQWIIEGLNNGPSGLKYTCDEFPPATFIQGGGGVDGLNKGTIICAASSLRCIGSVYPQIRAQFSSGNNYGEQDWQGASHGLLRRKMITLYGMKRDGSGNYPLGAFQFATTTLAAPVAGAATTHAPRHENVTSSAIDQARALIEAAIQEQSKYNELLFKNPRRNDMVSNTALRRRGLDLTPPTINDTVAEAAALLAELAVSSGNLTVAARSVHHSGSNGNEKRDTAWWYDDINHNGIMAFNPNSSTYPVWRNVVVYGADPTGQTDSTKAINNAISDGNRCGSGCNSSSINGAVVYFPAGTYLVSGSIISLYNTQLVGNPTSKPTILAAPSFVGLGMISSDVYIDGGSGAEWYINQLMIFQNNFFRQIRNFIIDIRQATVSYPAGLHWQVAQATSLQNIDFLQNTGTQQGIFAENGSGGFMSDLTFTGGNFGLYGGNQQYTVRNLTFTGCTTGIGLIWDWGWTWKDLNFNDCGTGLNMIGTGGSLNTGSVYILDSTCSNTNVCLLSSTPLSGVAAGTTYITLDNFVLTNSATAIQDNTGATILAGGTTSFNSWSLGRVYDVANPNGTFTSGSEISPVRPLTADLRQSSGEYFARSKPQYESYTASSVVNVKTATGAHGDGTTDDTANINACLSANAGKDVIIFFPQGVYIVTDTITIPKGTKIVGEVWSQIMASGTNFQDMNNPHVMVRVGNAGDVGSVEIQDMLFTVKGATAGAVLVEWNIKADAPGSAGMWDSHFRVGGAAGTDLQVADCPKLTGKVNPKCIAASMHLHLTAGSSAYLENVWAWTADHDIEDPNNSQIDIYSARGILIESTGPTWLYGTAAEHNVLYQYELYQAKDIFMGMIQTESPYFFPTPQAPAPFTTALGQFNADPNFSNCGTSSTECTVSWALRIISSDNVQITGAGLYSWFFDEYSQACVDTQNCQQSLVSTYLSSNLWLFNIITLGSVEMISPYGTNYPPALAKSNTDSVGHPYWSIINAWLLLSQGSTSNVSYAPSQTVTVASWFWAMPTPSVSCWYPCVVVLPPITIPAIQPPLITSVISGTTQTITPPVFSTPAITPDPITLTAEPSVTTAISTVTSSVLFNQTAIPYPPFMYNDTSNSQQNISGIYIPLPLRHPSQPGQTTGSCWFLCSWPPNFDPVTIENGSPWPRPIDTPPPDLDTSDDEDDDTGDDDEGDDDDDGGGSNCTDCDGQPQEPESSTTSTTSSTTTSTSSSSSTSCDVVMTLALATSGISLSSGGWASAYPAALTDPVYGTSVSIGGTYTPIVAQSVIRTNPGTTATTATTAATTTAAATTTTTSTAPKPTLSGGASLRYDFLVTSLESDNVWTYGLEGYGSADGSSYDECSITPDWRGSAAGTDMPASLTGVTISDVGATCSYAQTTAYASAAKGAIVGALTCSGYSVGTCYKEVVATTCSGLGLDAIAYCLW